MKFICGRGNTVFNGQHWVTEKIEWEVSDESEIKKNLASGWFSRFEDDGQFPKYHVIERTPRDQFSEDFYNQLLQLGADGYEVFYVDAQRIFFIKRK